MSRQKNPTLFSLLKAGCTINFPSGYSLVGDPKNGYIDLRTDNGSDGLEVLTKEGLDRSLKEEKKYQKEKED